MPVPPDAHEDSDRDPEPELPTSLVPRWLALVVLVALLASATFSVCSLMSR